MKKKITNLVKKSYKSTQKLEREKKNSYLFLFKYLR